MWEKILTGAISCLVALIITLLFNYAVNKPKKDQQKRQEELESLEKRLTDKLENINIAVTILRDENKIQMEGIQSVLKNDLKVRYLKWIKLKYAPMDAKDDLERMYKVYHKLGANGVMDGLRREFLNLPEMPKKESTKRKTITDVELEIEKEASEE